MSSIKDNVSKVRASTVNLYKTYEEPIKKALDVGSDASAALAYAEDAFDLIKGTNHAHEMFARAGVRGTLGRLGAAGTAIGAVTSVVMLPSTMSGTVKVVRDAIRGDSLRDGIRTSLDSVTNTLSDLYASAWATKRTGELASAAVKAYGARVPAAVVTAASAAVVEEGALGAQLAVTTATGASALGKLAGRFMPGISVAIATAEIARSVSISLDPKASVGKKLAAGVTALASMVQATNIPIWSQGGAIVAIASSIAGSYL